MHALLTVQIKAVLEELKEEKEISGETPDMSELEMLKSRRKVVTTRLSELAEPDGGGD